MASAHASRVRAHYGRAGLGAAILEAVRTSLGDPAHLRWEELAAIDQLHSRGREATEELAALAALRPGERVLDVGGGMGGAARMLAATIGCRVTVLDLTEELCEVGEMLTRRTGLESLVTFRVGDALDMPFADGEFDVGWTQHSTMNIPRKDRLHAELFRVVRPGGRLAMHEILAGSVEPPLFPLPWASEPSISFLLGEHATRHALARAGFIERDWNDVSAATLDWMRALHAKARPAAPPPLGAHLTLGPSFATAFASVVRNLQEQRLAVVEAVLGRP